MKGYKHTELGWIPEEWKIKKIKEWGTVITGNTPPTNDQSNYGEDYLFISPLDLGSRKYISFSSKRVSKKGFTVSRKLPKGAVLYTCIGSTIGKVGILTEEGTCNQQINAIICNETSSNEYLFYELINRSEEIKLIAGRQAIPIINKTQFENINLIAPPLSQQAKISRILLQWDLCIEHQTELVNKKELLRKGLMQSLLADKSKTSGHTRSWKTCTLNDVGSFHKGKGILKGELSESGIPCVRYGEIYTSHHYLIKKFLSFIPAKVAKESQPITGGVVLFAGSGETLDEIGKAVAYVGNSLAYAGGDIIILKVNDDVNPVYLSYLLNTDSVKKQKRELGQGHSVVHLYPSDFKRIRITIPEKSEQDKIAKIFMSIDKEIEILKRQLDFFKSQKRGLMQKLLSGRKRVQD